jgi:hypothetical protein
MALEGHDRINTPSITVRYNPNNMSTKEMRKTAELKSV